MELISPQQPGPISTLSTPTLNILHNLISETEEI